MKCNSCLHTRRARVALFLFAAALFALFLSIGFFRVIPVPATDENNNPQDFYLWSTDSSFAYAFRYDPRAADVWLFKSGGDTRFILRDLSNSPGSRTNR